MNYRDKLYGSYVTTHTGERYGEVSRERVARQFPVLQKYFGEFLPADKNASVLDLGCGAGELVYWLREKGYANATGVDGSEQQIELTKKLGIADATCEDILSFLARSVRKYDLIIARDVLEHFTKDETMDLLKKINCALKPSGKFVAQTVNAANLFWGVLRYGDFTHEVAFTESSIAQVLSASGFDSISVKSQPPVAHGIVSAARVILWNILQFFIKGYFFIERGSAPKVLTQNLIVSALSKGKT